MRGEHQIIVQNRRMRYDFSVKRNITIMRAWKSQMAEIKDAIVFIIVRCISVGKDFCSGIDREDRRRLYTM